MKNNNIFYRLFPLLLVAVLLFAFVSIKKTKKKGFALVELYTSEGCSSCPPADALVAKTLAENKGKEVYVLAYHVDYWNRLGWKDRFSQPEFSQRQRKYADLLKSSVYTPQIVVNGLSAFVGSDRARLQKALAKYSSQPAKNALSVSVDFTSQKALKVQYNILAVKDVRLQLALVEKKAVTEVKDGENAGRTLSHVHIVSRLKTIEEPKADGMVTLTANHNSVNNMLTAFLENKITGEVIAIRQTDLVNLTAQAK